MSASGATSKATLCAQALHNDGPGALCWRPQNLRHFKNQLCNESLDSRAPGDLYKMCIFLPIYHVFRVSFLRWFLENIDIVMAGRRGPWGRRPCLLA